MTVATLTRSITVDAPVDAVFDFALDIGRLWKWKDVALTDVDIKPEGVGTSARMYTHLLAFHVEGGVEYTEVVPGQRIVAQVHFFAEKPTCSLRRSRRGGSCSNPSTAAPR